MGFDPFQTALLLFEGSRFHGSEIRVRLDASLEDYETFVALPKHSDEIVFLAEKVLVDWNLEKDGKPIPCDLAGIKTLPLALTRRIVVEWINLVTGVSDPLGVPSSNGSTSGVLSITTG
jgi:hypothetical protein